MRKDSLVYVAGHRGLVGSALCRALARSGYERLLKKARLLRCCGENGTLM